MSLTLEFNGRKVSIFFYYDRRPSMHGTFVLETNEFIVLNHVEWKDEKGKVVAKAESALTKKVDILTMTFNTDIKSAKVLLPRS